MALLSTTMSPLHPKYVENIFLKNLQGVPVATQFLPERVVGFPVVVYRRWGELGGMTPAAGEMSSSRTSSTEYSEEVARCVEYREASLISEQSIKFMNPGNQLGTVRDLQLDAAEHLSDRMILRQEYNTINALTTNAGNELDLAQGSGTAWNEANADPLDDLTEARRIIRKEGHVIPDTALTNADVEADLLHTAALKQWQFSGPLTQNPLASGSLEGAVIRGVKFYVTDAFMLAEERAAVAQSRTWAIEDRRAMKMMVWKTMVPAVFRPQFIVNIKNVRTDEV
jgi:hypothetical protein